MRVAQARAVRMGSQPVVVGLAENPCPGSDGITRWKASDGLPPWVVGSVRGPMSLSCSMIEPGQPWVTISGRASWWGERRWRKWSSRPSISVRNWGRVLRVASTVRQSWALAQ
jgi:hypothetical protein